MQIAFFGHDALDAAVRRRIQTFLDSEMNVIGFTMRRGDMQALPWENIDLGLTKDGAFIARVASVFTGAQKAARHKDKLAATDVIYARNLDMLACAFLAKRLSGLKTPVIYECLDVHRLLCGSGVVSRMMRWLEGALLKRTIGLVVSSPGFLTHHFGHYYPGSYKARIVENRLAAGADYGARPDVEQIEKARPQGAPLRFGWVGVLRCQRSLDLLCAAAQKLGPDIEIHLHGIPARTEISVFEPAIEAQANMHYHGRYKSPEDLARLYAGLDVVWAGDFMEAGYNSVWLLPNRIYEGGYYATPAIAPKGTQTALWIKEHVCGLEVSEPLEENLPELLQYLASAPDTLIPYARKLTELDETVFVQPVSYMRGVIEDLLAEERMR